MLRRRNLGQWSFVVRCGFSKQLHWFCVKATNQPVFYQNTADQWLLWSLVVISPPQAPLSAIFGSKLRNSVRITFVLHPQYVVYRQERGSTEFQGSQPTFSLSSQEFQKSLLSSQTFYPPPHPGGGLSHLKNTFSGKISPMPGIELSVLKERHGIGSGLGAAKIWIDGFPGRRPVFKGDYGGFCNASLTRTRRMDRE